MSDVEQVAEEEIDIDGVKTVKTLSPIRRCFSVFFKVIFSTPGLVVLVAVYSVIGALVFPLLEAPREMRHNAAIARSREDCLRELWIITEKLNVLYEKNWTMLVHEQLRRFEGSIVTATRNGLNGLGTDRTSRWSFSEALLYSVTVITTIGHGNLTPRTSGGKIVTILYALIGVPLMLMCLSSLGGLLANALQCTYTRLCCPKNDRSRNERQACNGQSYEMDCNVCKYDAVSSETKFHGYEYSTVSDREDSCHLIRNSPVKSNHGSPCAQIKLNPHTKQYFVSSESSSPVKQNQQQHHHHHHPQHHQGQHQHSATHSPQHFQLMHQIHRNSIGGCTANTGSSGGGDDGNISGLASTTTTAYFPVPTSGNHYTCNSTIHYTAPPPTIKYHGMQLPGQLSRTKSPEQQLHHAHPHHTATVHGIRRGKFLPKPMPQEINVLLVESDITFRHDLSGSNDPVSIGPGGAMSTGGNVDIMEDEEENEQNRLGCPHGTPSRIPLISSSVSSSPVKGHGIGGSVGPIGGNSMQIEEDALGDEADDENTTRETSSSTPQVPITIVLLILISYICLGTVIFSLWENWSIIDGAYFCFVTLSTIGYGDFLPQHTFKGPDVQLFACCAYLLLGLVLVAMSFSILETQLLWKCKRIAVRLKLAKD